jgi:signal peptidase I
MSDGGFCAPVRMPPRGLRAGGHGRRPAAYDAAVRRAWATAVMLTLAAAAAGCGESSEVKLKVVSGSMAPGIRPGDTVTLDQSAYDGARPEVGDVVVVHPAKGIDALRCAAAGIGTGAPCARAIPGTVPQEIVTRIVAGPGDRIAFRHGHVIRNGRPVREPYARRCTREVCELPRTIRVMRGHWFVAGDNRGAAADSRVWGPVPTEQIVGRLKGS